MKKVAILIILCLTAVACGACGTQMDSACVEQGLTEEECSNSGTHDYQYHLEIQGLGGVDCSGGEANTKDGSSTYTFTFLEDEGVMYEHPDELVWDSYIQPFMRTDENTYIFLGADEEMLQTWEVKFFDWGFTEQLTLTWDCTNGTCGCVTTGQYEIDG